MQIRPFEFPEFWSIKYYPRMLNFEAKVLWFGIDIHNKSNSVSADMEANKSEVLRDEGIARDRHVILPWLALERHLRAILEGGGSKAHYWDIYSKGEHYITDDLQPLGLLHPVVLDTSSLGWLGWSTRRQGTEQQP